MKNTALIINICLAVGMAACAPKPMRNSSIDDIVIEMLKAHPDLKAGMEPLPSLNDIIAVPPLANAPETEAEAVRRVSALIAKQTDYECRFHNHWLIIVPRPNKDRFALPNALRVCTAPAVKGVPVRDFFRRIKGARLDEPVTLRTEGEYFYTPYEPQGPVDIEQGAVPCFQLLCDVADQLPVRCWRMFHSEMFISGKLLLPVNLDIGIVSFHGPGQRRSSPGNTK